MCNFKHAQPPWPLLSVLNWFVFWDFAYFVQKSVYFHFKYCSRETLKIKGAWMNAYKVFTHPLPCHLWPVQCSVVPSMLYKRSADKAVPAVSLSWQPEDTRHSAGTGVPERKNMPSNIPHIVANPSKYAGVIEDFNTFKKETKYSRFKTLTVYTVKTYKYINIQIWSTYSGWSAGATGLHQSIWQQQRWVGLIPAGDGDRSQESMVEIRKTANGVGTSKETLLQNGIRVPVQYLCNLPVKMHQDQFCYCW